ncbi:MAG: CAP domain-containing protein [Clostridium sp.]|uniref:CAP domain-containing protein n=1 Tax=Clostridium sp. TaxID=1506 RepID=UPI003F3BBAE7
MKEKLIAIILSTTLLGGAAAMVYTSKNDKPSEDKKSEIAMGNGNSKNVEEKADLNKGNDKNKEASNDKVILKDKEVAKANIESNNGTAVNNTVKETSKKQTSSNGQAQKDDSKNSNTDCNKEESGNTSVNRSIKNPQSQSSNKPSGGNSNNVSNSSNFMAQVESKIFEKVNAERAKAGVPKLSYNNTMQKYARIKSQDMGDRNYFDHTDPNGNLITAKMKADGVSYRAWGENIAYIGGVSDADALANQFMTNWMNSPGHRQNILSTNFTGIGVGVYKSGDRVYATQEFYK